MAGSVVFGIAVGTVKSPRVAYLVTPLPVTPELLALSGPVAPAEVFRFAVFRGPGVPSLRWLNLRPGDQDRQTPSGRRRGRAAL